MSNSLKLEELEAGKIYTDLLSKKDVLVVMTDAQVVKDQKGKDQVIPAKKAGKSVIIHESGEFKWVYTELHDGQLTEKTN